MEETPNKILGTAAAPPTALDLLRRRFVVGPSDPASRSVWRVSQIYWGVVLFSGTWIVLRTYGIGGAPLPTGAAATLTGLFVLGTAHLALRSALTVRRGGYGIAHSQLLSWVHTVIDLSIVAATVRVTGGIESGIWPLFFVIVVAESVLEPIREARWVRIGVGFALIAATVPIPLTGGPWILELITRLVFLLAVSTVGQRLRQNSEREKAEIASLRAEMGLLAERSNLSREIHDGVGNALAASVLRLEVTARILDKKRNDGSLDAPGLLREEAQALRDAMNGVRDWTFFNKPWSMTGDNNNLPSERLAAEVERLSRRTNIPMGVEGAETMNLLRGATTQLAVFRIVQEALTNTAKYAEGATEAIVRLHTEDGRMILSITDNGAGFDTSLVTTGIGTSSMRERATGMGGSLNIESTPGKGTVVIATLPLT